MNEKLIQLRDTLRREVAKPFDSDIEYNQGYEEGYNQCANYVLSVLDSVPSRCGWFGEGRGQCLLKAEHEDIHTCEEDGRLLEAYLESHHHEYD